MKRREFSVQLAVAALLPLVTRQANAQGAPVEGQNYIRLAQPVATSVPPGKVDVIEFFWYGCPHCNALEPVLEAWLKHLPPQIAFRRVHVGFTALHETHQKIFYTLEAMNLVEQLHRKVFAAIHVQHRRLDKESDIAAFATENGVDANKFMEVYKSFAVQTKARQAKQLTDAYKIDGVPALGVQGRYYTSVGLAGSQQNTLAVVEYLTKKVQAGG
ncbi:MAG TPA: thiol:disulfide interchange protein DsbA/DsbL [Burkholderiaceae bacterium]|nr:thiol:disulfide interchange protein DsbA/DsbL [Burkholderiaceae bacterium]